MSKNKIGRNDPCPCGSNKKYKLCHWGFDREAQPAPSGVGFNMNPTGVKLFNKMMQAIANEDVPLHEFCLENNIYYFKNHSLDQDIKIKKMFFQDNNLTKSDLFTFWAEFHQKEFYTRMLKNDENMDGILSKRSNCVSDIITAHYSELYSIAIPTAFSVIEGIFREYGQISFDKNQKTNYQMSEINLKEKMLYADIDSIRYFTKFLNKIMSGSASETDFHRNTVMHGVNTKYATKENSLLLLMTLFEFARLSSLNKLWPQKTSIKNGDYYINGYKIEMCE